MGSLTATFLGSALSPPTASTSVNRIRKMVLLTTTERILAAFEAVPASRHETLHLPATLEADGPIAHEQLIRLARYLQTDPDYHAAASHTPTVLSSLLRGTKVYVPPPPKKPEPVCRHAMALGPIHFPFPVSCEYANNPRPLLTNLTEPGISRLQSASSRCNGTGIL